MHIPKIGAFPLDVEGWIPLVHGQGISGELKSISTGGFETSEPYIRIEIDGKVLVNEKLPSSQNSVPLDLPFRESLKIFGRAAGDPSTTNRIWMSYLLDSEPSHETVFPSSRGSEVVSPTPEAPTESVDTQEDKVEDTQDHDSESRSDNNDEFLIEYHLEEMGKTRDQMEQTRKQMENLQDNISEIVSESVNATIEEHYDEIEEIVESDMDDREKKEEISKEVRFGMERGLPTVLYSLKLSQEEEE